jgi:hypothetical protein
MRGRVGERRRVGRVVWAMRLGLTDMTTTESNRMPRATQRAHRCGHVHESGRSIVGNAAMPGCNRRCNSFRTAGVRRFQAREPDAARFSLFCRSRINEVIS